MHVEVLHSKQHEGQKHEGEKDNALGRCSAPSFQRYSAYVTVTTKAFSSLFLYGKVFLIFFSVREAFSITFSVTLTRAEYRWKLRANEHLTNAALAFPFTSFNYTLYRLLTKSPWLKKLKLLVCIICRYVHISSIISIIFSFMLFRYFSYEAFRDPFLSLIVSKFWLFGFGRNGPT